MTTPETPAPSPALLAADEPDPDQTPEERAAFDRAERLRSMPVSDLSAREVLDARNSYPSGPWSDPSHRRYRELEARKEEVQDEIASARDRARKGLGPDPAWTRGLATSNEDMRLLERALDAEPDNALAKERLKRAHARRVDGQPVIGEIDPRLEAWRSVTWSRVTSCLRDLPDRHAIPDAPTAEVVSALESALSRALDAVRSFRGASESGA